MRTSAPWKALAWMLGAVASFSAMAIGAVVIITGNLVNLRAETRPARA